MSKSSSHLGRLLSICTVCAVALWACHGEPPEPEAGKEDPTSGQTMSHYDVPDARLASSRFGFDHIEPAAPRPTGPLAEGATCVTPACHSQFATATRVHAPAGQGQCDACHDKDAGGHKYPLKREGSDTCKFCHYLPQTSYEHPPVSDPGCITCHSPHYSEARFLMTEASTGRVCAQCHDMPLGKFAHGSFAAGQCGLCHRPHGADNAKLLRGGTGADHCLSCHTDLAERLASQTHLHSPLLQKDCSRCHQVHTSDHPKLLVAEMDQLCFQCHEEVGDKIASASIKHGALNQPDQCASCHDPHAAPQPYLLKARQDQVCLQCHDQPQQRADGQTIPSVAGELKMPYLHGPVRSAECSACHQTHGSDHAFLLDAEYPRTFYANFTEEQYKLCFECHTKQMVLKPKTQALTNFRDGERNLHFVHVNRQDKGRTCRSCHEVHGARRPRHIAESVPFEGSGWAMPIGYEEIDDGGRCSPGCHEPMKYQRSRQADDAAMRGGS